MDRTGTHILADYSGCDSVILKNCDAVEDLLVKAGAAAGATVVDRKSHRAEDSGVICVVVLQNSRLSIHTWPSDRYAAADFFEYGKCDSHNALAVLEAGLSAESSKVVVLERGLPGTPRIRVLGYRAIERIMVDCSSSALPETVRVDRSPGRGLGLFATRAFGSADLVYETSMRLASFDTEYVMQSDVGESILTADQLGSELTISAVEDFPGHIRDALVANYGLDAPSSVLLRDKLTGGEEREVLITTFDGLMNHSRNPNATVEPVKSVSFEDGEPVWIIRIVAVRSIDAGDELFWDYSEASSFIPPKNWLP